MCAICLTTSCGDSGDTLQETGSAEFAIGFSASLDDGSGVAYALGSRATRAVGDGEFGLDPVNTNQELQESGFGVYCWYTGMSSFDPAFPTPKTHIKDFMGDNGYLLMRNQKVEWKDWNGTGTNVWSYAPSKYWPINQEEMLTLRAYAPYTSYMITDSHGMPQLPVVVDKDDYHKGTQHDPLWGTGRVVEPSGEYASGTTYGEHYDNITYRMSGDKRLTSDSRDGIIDWYFHHGMSCLMFSCSVIADPGCDKVVIRGIQIEKLYTQGLLSLSSLTASEAQKPTWDDRSGDMTVNLTNKDDNADLAIKPFEINTNLSPPAETTPVNLLSNGLLIIPRDHVSSGDGLKVTLTYSIDSDTEPLIAEGYIKRIFEGNTKYTLAMQLTPATRGLDIDIVQSAFTSWTDGGSGEREVYNW